MEIFNFEGNYVKIKITKDEIWFVAHDVTDILGFDESISKAIKDHVDKEDYMINNGIYLVNESGLYNLIFASNLLIAMKFKKWIISEVLSKIRNHGKENIYKEWYNDETYKKAQIQCLISDYYDRHIKYLEKSINKKDELIDKIYEIVTRIKDTY
ncbi:BRO-N domain-containing protein [Sneathia sanguinegens]|uniref:BRO-N domain-containing protein n=1 Tax=Sneathia sanguinegens TaxID=40543 RepID=UPI0023F7FDA6|nr:BRO family protein [Sneathia sanguinegens]